jgi:hypothetical protein
MKNLSTCTPEEFLKQTVRIKRAAEKWLSATDIINIRKNIPEFEKIGADMNTEQKAEIYAENKRRRSEQAMANLSKIIDAIAEEHPAETLELLALVCFVEPKDVNKHLMGEYLESITEMITDQAVVGFFTSLAKLGQMRI